MKRYGITVWHGEGRSAFHVVDRQASDQPEVIASRQTRKEAEKCAAILNLYDLAIRTAEHFADTDAPLGQLARGAAVDYRDAIGEPTDPRSFCELCGMNHEEDMHR